MYLGDATCLERVSDPGPGSELQFRLFAGYAGWGPDQLEGELSEGVWAVVPANGPLLFETPADELWDRLLPPTLPQQ